jgi:Skp family chaperone for outer membrane proteins
VKRTVITLTGLLTLGVAAYVASHLRADPNFQQANAVGTIPHNKVAVINLMGVVKKYEKWQQFENAYKGAVEKYDKFFEAKKQQLLDLKKLFESTPDADKKEQIQTQMKAVEREGQDASEKAKKELGKYREDMAVQIYKEVQEAAARYARAHDIGMVLHYADAEAPAEVYHPINVLRKLQTQPCVPMYVDPELDITNSVSAMLNQALGVPNNGGR